VIIAALNYISQPFSAPAVCCRLPLSLSSITGQPTSHRKKDWLSLKLIVQYEAQLTSA